MRLLHCNIAIENKNQNIMGKYEQISTSKLPDLSFHEDKNLNIIFISEGTKTGGDIFYSPAAT